jgi:hypothetical protein
MTAQNDTGSAPHVAPDQALLRMPLGLWLRRFSHFR